jgi:hypothetical protein
MSFVMSALKGRNLGTIFIALISVLPLFGDAGRHAGFMISSLNVF